MAQVLDPDARLGTGSEDYAVIKSHPFFAGVDWDGLSAASPPKVSSRRPRCVAVC